MKTRLLHLWDELTSSYWFIPSAMLIGAVILAVLSLLLDRHVKSPQHSLWVYTGGPEGARSLLSTVAGSVITVAGVVFSITIAALVQASSQFGPRLLRNFMRDTGNQIVLGTFVATFIYCLLVLRAVRGGEGYAYVPNVSVSIALLMAVGSLAVLIYFIHHISVSLQGPVVVALVGMELQRSLEGPFPEAMGHPPAGPTVNDAPAREIPADRTIPSGENGYVQAVDEDTLLHFAVQHGAVIHLVRRPGEYVIAGNPLMWVERGPNDLESAKDELTECFFIGRQRTAEQDVEYSIRQLVEIAVRALSPGINDPFTAINCVDWLGAAIAKAARRGLPSRLRYDDDGQLRIVVHALTFGGMVDGSFNQIRQYAASSVAVNVRLLEVIAQIGPRIDSADQRLVLAAHADMILRSAQAHTPEAHDLQCVLQRHESAHRVLHV